ncbi:hypothetical protein [Luteimicrobium subarcticum]|uniref:hypothetical protein n=1 Tax=Luteimicrobium subarcticum TaxID=620910 RepID=UPI0012FE4B1C|nr:hypothetical protein [Luteimicrobium subarcticum]
MNLAPAPAPARRVGRLHAPDSRLVGHLVTRVATHWDVVGPHRRPLYANPKERLEWRVAYVDHRPDLYCDDPAAVTHAASREIAGGHLVVDGADLHVTWLDGQEAEDAWRTLRW